MLLRLLSRCWTLIRNELRPRPQARRRKTARAAARPRLAVTRLEGRAMPSAVTAPVLFESDRDLVLDYLAFRFERPLTEDRWAVPLDRIDRPEESPPDGETAIFAAFLAVSMGTAAVAPYDREEDAQVPVFHGVSVV